LCGFGRSRSDGIGRASQSLGFGSYCLTERLLVLVGTYAVHHYLELPQKVKLTDIVRGYEDYLPGAFPLVHPSPRNQIWMKKNPWFESEVVPALQDEVRKALS
jgi:uracil-DNA glycosylase